MLPVAILAGGLAKRLRPLTKNIPKALVEVAGKPFLYHQLNYLSKQGVSKVILCVGYLGKKIKAKIGNGKSFGLEILYSFDETSPLGTGGSLKKALPLLNNDFFVLYGDTFLPINFSAVEKFYFDSKKPALMTLIRNNNSWDKSNVFFKKNLILEYNKQKPNSAMKYIDYGLGILSKRVFNEYKQKEYFDLAEIYYKLSIENNLVGYEVFKRFYEIGSIQGLKDTEKYLNKNLVKK
jgi:NDP-sugar pyrophosphorylase family protein